MTSGLDSVTGPTPVRGNFHVWSPVASRGLSLSPVVSRRMLRDVSNLATQKPKHRQNMARPSQPTPGKSRPNHHQKHALESIPWPAPPRSQNIDKTWPGPVSQHMKKVARTIPRSVSSEHSLANATQRRKHRQNMDRPSQPTPGKSRPNHSQRHAWRAFPC